MRAPAILTWDRHAERWLVEHRFADPLWEWLSRLGVLGGIWLALGLLLAILRARPALFVAVLAADGGADLAAGLLKLAIPRHRPRVHTLLPHLTDHSFPSGHAATSFACATVLAAAEPRLRVPLYVLAALVAFSRLEVGLHFPLDVAGGAVLGVAWALLLRTVVLRSPRRPGAGPRRRRRSPRAG